MTTEAWAVILPWDEPALPDYALLFHGVQVVVGVADPNPLVAGAGIKILKDAGIEVRC